MYVLTSGCSALSSGKDVYGRVVDSMVNSSTLPLDGDCVGFELIISSSWSTSFAWEKTAEYRFISGLLVTSTRWTVVSCFNCTSFKFKVS